MTNNETRMKFEARMFEIRHSNSSSTSQRSGSRLYASFSDWLMRLKSGDLAGWACSAGLELASTSVSVLAAPPLSWLAAAGGWL